VASRAEAVLALCPARGARILAWPSLGLFQHKHSCANASISKSDQYFRFKLSPNLHLIKIHLVVWVASRAEAVLALCPACGARILAWPSLGLFQHKHSCANASISKSDQYFRFKLSPNLHLIGIHLVVWVASRAKAVLALCPACGARILAWPSLGLFQQKNSRVNASISKSDQYFRFKLSANVHLIKIHLLV
jgi:predicted RNA-binding Zn-ribbon protein involved in translation (DUF1610 family)